jgi:hypothetical protein
VPLENEERENEILGVNVRVICALFYCYGVCINVDGMSVVCNTQVK